MKPKLPLWLIIVIISAIVVALAALVFFMFRWNSLAGWISVGFILAVLAVVAIGIGPHLYKLYKFNQYFKKHEASLRLLPGLMQSGRTEEALVRFEGVMKNAPENAYVYYMRAFFLNTSGKLPEALSSANKALALIDKDPFLPMLLEQGGEMGQPTTVAGFRAQLEDLKSALEPRVQQMRVRREKAISQRKKKSR